MSNKVKINKKCYTQKMKFIHMYKYKEEKIIAGR